MPSRTVRQTASDPALFLALGTAAAAAFIGQFVFGTEPAFFIPVGICALPFAASRGRRLHYRLAAVAMLLLFMVTMGAQRASLFAPSLAALAVASFRTAPRTARAARRGR